VNDSVSRYEDWLLSTISRAENRYKRYEERQQIGSWNCFQASRMSTIAHGRPFSKIKSGCASLTLLHLVLC
jgi:hypothetical protein